MSAPRRDPLAAMAEVSEAYGRALAMLRPAWKSEPDLPRYIAKRIAVRLLELAVRDRDMLIGVVLLRSQHGDNAELSLKTGAVIAAIVQYVALPPQARLDAVVAGLLHRVGQDTHGAYASDPDGRAQRALLGLLLSPTADPGSYRQVLAAFQYKLGIDGTGVPKMDFPVRQHPIAAVLAIAAEFVELTSRAPDGSRSAVTAARALRDVGALTETRFHACLVEVLARVVGPAPVGSMVVLADGRNAIVVRYTATDDNWECEVVDIEDPSSTEVVDGTSAVSGIYDALPALRVVG